MCLLNKVSWMMSIWCYGKGMSDRNWLSSCELNWISHSWPCVVVKHEVCLSVKCGS